MSTENQEAISRFLKSSVLPSTDRKYERQWGQFVQFMKDCTSCTPAEHVSAVITAYLHKKY
jgi:hypothetical protein